MRPCSRILSAWRTPKTTASAEGASERKFGDFSLPVGSEQSRLITVLFLLAQGDPQVRCISLSSPQEIYSRPRAHGTRLPLQTKDDVAS